MRVECPVCGERLNPSPQPGNSPAYVQRQALKGHMDKVHPELGIRERSLLRDQAVEGEAIQGG